MLYWINFLHIYQPPTQDKNTLKKVADESYSHILNLLEKYPEIKMTLNLSGSLVEKFQEFEYFEILERFKKHLQEGRIELTGSAMYHPILPLIPDEEVRHQISENTKKLKEVFKELYEPKGFYFPEMAYSQETALIVKDMGFEWIILDEMHSTEKIESSTKYEIEGVGLKVIFRDKKFSKSFPPKSIVENLSQIKSKYLITAHDGEMYGHWHKDDEGFYEKILKNPKIKTLTVLEYLQKLEQTKKIEVREANWESTEEEINEGAPFALWSYPINNIQFEFWRLQKDVYEILTNNLSDPNYSSAKKHFDKGIASCYWWWASERKIDAFSPVSWNPTEIEEGLEELLRGVRSLENLDIKKRAKVEKDFNNLRNEVWQRHWEIISETKQG